MKNLGGIITGIGMVMAFLIVSTDDYYTMELRVNRPIDWKGLIISMALMGIGLLIRWLANNFYIEVRKKGHRYEHHSHI